ncbi:hypothetical protein NBD05_24245, partial [Salmonella sp. NW1016]|uniref:hypothetical protein n=1 Tax=Salmonella sp. NW1016 TaxID=2947453 RepID=UPI003F480F00
CAVETKMNSLGVFAFLAAVAAATASLHGGAVIAGPSGSISADGLGHGVVAGPTGVNLGLGHGAVVAPGIVGLGHAGLGLGGLGLGGLGLGAGLVGLGHAGLDVDHGGLVGSGIEGQWIPDINEHLHDDGSYKPHIYGH